VTVASRRAGVVVGRRLSDDRLGFKAFKIIRAVDTVSKRAVALLFEAVSPAESFFGDLRQTGDGGVRENRRGVILGRFQSFAVVDPAVETSQGLHPDFRPLLKPLERPSGKMLRLGVSGDQVPVKSEQILSAMKLQCRHEEAVHDKLHVVQNHFVEPWRRGRFPREELGDREPGNQVGINRA
jgi:hypothetical protein